MLVITGVFENERFIPDKPVSIPQGTRVVVVADASPEAVAGETAPLSSHKVTLTAEQEARDRELYNLHAEELNREAMEVFLDQELDI